LGNTVIFDFDGTIVDSAPAILATLEQVLAAHQLAPRRSFSRDLIGPPLDATLTALTGITDKSRLEQLITDFKAIYDGAGLESTILYSGMDVLIRDLAQSSYRLMLATNKRQYPTERLLAKFKLTGYFKGIHCLDTRSPPYLDKATMLTALLQNESLTPQQSIYIGDTCHDELAAEKAGLPFMAVAWGYGIGVQLVSAKAKIVLEPSMLLAAITRHFGD
jgi:phosphoglycolate phosphatase